MDFKKITKEEFEEQKCNLGFRNIPQQGKLDGSYEDFLDFLKWTLESNHNKNEEHLKEAVKFSADKFGMSMTTQFLKNQMGSNFPNKTMRIKYLLNESGMTTTPINRYSNSVVNTKMKLKEFGTERSYSVGHTYRRLGKEILNLLIDKNEQEQKIADMNKRFDEIEAKRLLEEQKPQPEAKPEVIEAGIEISCGKCGRTIKIPLTPNMDTIPEERLCAGIYSCFIQGVQNGTQFCSSCEIALEKEGLWKIKELTRWLQQNKGLGFEFTPEEFCNEFRNDKMTMSGTTIKHKLESLEMPIKCRLKNDSIQVFVKE